MHFLYDMVFRHSRDITTLIALTILIALAIVVYNYDCTLLQLVSILLFYQPTIIPTLIENS